MNNNSDRPRSINPNFTFETSQSIRIPNKRIGAVIGKGGVNREAIEKTTMSQIIIDSDTGEVEVRPNKNLKDPVLLIKAVEVIKAIGRGFNYKVALKLAKDDYYLDIIRLKTVVGKTHKQIRRIKSRVIGTEGKTRSKIEELTSTNIVIGGSTVSFIGTYEQNSLAFGAITQIINGAQIEKVIKSLEDKKKESKKAEKSLWKAEGEIGTTLEEAFDKDKEEVDVFADFEEE